MKKKIYTTLLILQLVLFFMAGYYVMKSVAFQLDNDHLTMTQLLKAQSGTYIKGFLYLLGFSLVNGIYDMK